MSHSLFLSGLREALHRKDSSLLRKPHFIELAALWGYKSDVWRMRRNTKRPRASAERACEQATPAAKLPPRALLSPPPSPIGSIISLSQLPDGLEAQLRASAAASMDVPAGEQAYDFLRDHAAIPCELLSRNIVHVMLPSTQALADIAAANLFRLRAAAAAMSPAELANPLAWMARSQELPRQLDEHLMVVFAGVASSGASLVRLHSALDADGLGTVCDQAFQRFMQQSNSDLARFLCQAQSAMALMRQEICGRFLACSCLVGELLVEVLGFRVAMERLQLSCATEREASAHLL